MSTKNSQNYNDAIKSTNKSTINGYIREIEKKSFSNHSFYRTIPMIINYLCIKYYHESKDKFHPELHNDQITIQSDPDIATFIRRPDSFDGASLFLSNSVSKGVHHWKFKIITINDVIFIGICDNSVDLKTCCDSYFYWQVLSSFGVNLWTGKLRGNEKRDNQKKYCSRGKKDDIVEMCLNLNKRQLSFIINDKDCGKAFDIPDATYTAGLSLAGQNASVELMEYRLE